ncbi:hypothetical protein KUV89_15195 [Marinobacter hydrocarbonoclasticus]|nr:hypothetical protein [Marinobacter nauticus]
MTQLLAHIDCLERYRFFQRLSTALPDHRWQLITGRLSLLRLARQDGFPCHWLRRGAPSLPEQPKAGLEQALAWRSPQHWKQLQNATWEALEALAAVDCTLLIWNGCRTVEQTMTRFAQQRNLKVVYLELGNFPGRLFADPQGVNAQSRLASRPEILDTLTDPVEAFENWRADYLARRQQPPQSAQVTRVNQRWWLDQLGYLMGGLSADEPLWKRAWRKWRARRQRIPASATIPTVPFVLYPMQVSSDSQLLFNSDVGNQQALQQASEYARSLGMTLCIKPHPAEPDPDVLPWLLAQSQAHGWLLTSAPMPQLLPHAEAVVTINSTVGLEALLLDKPLQVLGRCHYSAFTPKRLRQYLMSHLLPIDYFTADPITRAQADALLAHAETVQ